MAAGELTARRLTEACLARIAALDRQGPELRSVIETNPEALAIADALDAERKAKGPRGPLHGIPVLVKDNVDTADRMTTTAGSLALEGSTPPRDAHVAARLREAGAVILGKANLSEWANFRSSRSVSGWSAPRRPVPQPLRPRPQPLRLELGLGRRGLREPRAPRGRHRDGRLDRLPRPRTAASSGSSRRSAS